MHNRLIRSENTNKNSESKDSLFLFGGADGTRTRDPLRDRQVF